MRTDELAVISPPAEALAELDAGAARAHELRDHDRELRFTTDPCAGRVVAEVRDLAGTVLRTISGSEALAILDGAPVDGATALKVRHGTPMQLT